MLNSNYKLFPKKQFLLAGLAFIFLISIFYFFPIHADDWVHTFYPVSKVTIQPYSIKSFINPPWTALILHPFRYFLETMGEAINASLNILVVSFLVLKRKGNFFSLVLTVTSLPLFLLLLTGSIEWIPALGFLLQNEWGVPLLMTKPQSGILAGLSWFLNSKKKLLFITPAVIVSISSFFIWGNWIGKILENIRYMDEAKIGLYTVNFSPFPWSIPIGLGLLFYIFKKRPENGEFLGALATYCLVPYFYPHSLIIPFALISASHRRLSILFWILLWLYPIVLGWTEISQALGY